MAQKSECSQNIDCNQMEPIEFLLEGVFSTIVGVIGILGNVAAIAYFRKRRRSLHTTFHGLMTALAVYDLIIIISLILLISIPKFSSEFEGSGFYQNFAPWILFIAHIGLEGSIYLTMAISIERYLVICHPIFYRIHSWSTKAFVVPITCFSIIFSIPKLFELETKVMHRINHVVNYTKEDAITKQCLLPLNLTQPDQQQHSSQYSYEACALWFRIKFGSGVERLDVPETCTDVNLDTLLDKLLTSTTHSIVPTQLRQNPCYYQIYIVWLNIIFNGIGPFVVLILLNTSIVRQLVLNERRGSGRRGKAGSSPSASARLRIHHHPTQKRKRETKVSMAKVSFAIVFVFIICHSIRWIPNIYEFFWGFGSKNNAEWPIWIHTLMTLSHLLVILNSSVNFYIYLFKLHIMYYTLTNCCREEMIQLSSKTRRAELAKENEAKEICGQEIARDGGSKHCHQDNFTLSTLTTSCQQVPDIVQSSVSD